jgi:hypothetical protein
MSVKIPQPRGAGAKAAQPLVLYVQDLDLPDSTVGVFRGRQGLPTRHQTKSPPPSALCIHVISIS